MAGILDNFAKIYEARAFTDKVKMVSSVSATTIRGSKHYPVQSLYWDGYIEKKSADAVKPDTANGEYYVYIWKHSQGELFYVGSGHDDRWIDKNSRNDDFYKHLDKADAVVYKVLTGVDRRTALDYETYISVLLTEAGIDLANRDNRNKTTSKNDKIASLKELELTKRIELVVLNKVINDTQDCLKHYAISELFKKTYGETFFSDKYGKVQTEIA